MNDKSEFNTLKEKLEKSTSDEKEMLDLQKVSDGDIIRFDLKKKGALGKLKDKFGKNKGKGSSDGFQNFEIDEDLVKKGIKMEFVEDKSAFWVNLKLTQNDNPFDESYQVKLSNDKDGNQLLGEYQKPFRESQSIYLPHAVISLIKLKNSSIKMTVEAIGTSLIKPAYTTITSEQFEGKEIVIGYSDKGMDYIERADGKENYVIVDARSPKEDDKTFILSSVTTPSFYRGGNEPLICFDCEKVKFISIEELEEN